MEDPDFSGIDPLRLPEARRRVAAITDYLRIPSPTVADATRHAAAIGLSRFQFYRLAKVWRAHRRPSLLVAGRRGEGSRDYGVAARAVEIAKEEIATAGADAELATIAIAVETRCAADGIAPPSRPTLWSYIMKARADGVATGPPAIVVGRLWFHLPIEGAPPADMPTLMVAVLVPERVIVAHAISVDADDPPDVAAVVGRLASRCTPDAPARPLLIEAADRHAAATALAAAGLDAVRSHPRSVQRALARAFGERLGPLKTIYRRGSARPATKRVIKRLDQPLPAAEAIGAITDAVGASNASAVAEPPFDIANR